VIDFGKIDGNYENPQDTMVQNGTSALSVCAIHSGLAAVGDLAVLAVCHRASNDAGNLVQRVDRQTTASTTNFTIGYTAASDDVGFACLAICEASASKTGSEAMALAQAEAQSGTGTATVSDTHALPTAEYQHGGLPTLGYPVAGGGSWVSYRRWCARTTIRGYRRRRPLDDLHLRSQHKSLDRSGVKLAIYTDDPGQNRPQDKLTDTWRSPFPPTASGLVFRIHQRHADAARILDRAGC